MKLQGHANKLETNVENETQEFGIGDASVVIEILRNRLYENKIQTLVQEYICNARDSHRELGKNNEFEITVPTRLNPVFKVRDFGPGISPARMKDVFVMYGASTKRSTNNQTGGFGIGAKSAWSYTDSFTIVSIVDGIRRTYIAHTGVNNNGRLDLVSSDVTDELNGTEIQVAVKPHDIEEFRKAVFRAIYFWEEKPKLKGELDPPMLVQGIKIGEYLEVIDSGLLPEYIRNGYYDAMAVIDGILYPVSQKLNEKIKSLEELSGMVRGTILLHFGNGIVEVSASRESIADSPSTVKNLESIVWQSLVSLKAYIKNEFAKVKTVREYLNTYVHNNKYFNVDGFAKYGDYSIIGNALTSVLFDHIKITQVHCLGKYGRGRTDKITKEDMTHNRNIYISSINDLFFITTPENKIVQNKRFREYFKTNDRLFILEVLERSEPAMGKDGKPVLDNEKKPVFQKVSYPNEYAQVIGELGARDLSTITYVSPPKVKKEKVKRGDEQVCLHVLDGTRIKYITTNTNEQKWLYVPLAEGKWGFDTDRLKQLNAFFHETDAYDLQICGLSLKEEKKIVGNKNFSLFSEWLEEYKPLKDHINTVKYRALQNREYLELITDLSVKGIIDDPQIKEMHEEFLTTKPLKNSKNSMPIPEILENKIKDLREFKEFHLKEEQFGQLIKSKYSLLQEFKYDCYYKPEVIFYMNAKYESEKGK